MGDAWDGRERRDADGLCLWHSSGEVRMKQIEEKLKGIEVKQGRQNSLINIGIGLVMAAALIASVMFAQLDNVKADTNATVEKHIAASQDNQRDLNDKLFVLQSDVARLQRNVDVMATKVEGLAESINKDIKSIDNSMKELKEYIKDIHANGGD